MSKILSVINERLEKGKENGFQGIETKLKKEDLLKATGLDKESFDKELGDLVKDKKLFYFQPTEEKIAYDGTFKQVEKGTCEWSLSEEWYKDKKGRQDDFLKSLQEKKEKGRLESYESKLPTVKNLSENAQKVFEEVHNATKEKAYIFIKDIKLDLEFEDMKAAIKELRDAKATFQIQIGKQVSIEGKDSKVQKDWVLTNSGSLLHRVLEREKAKEEMGILPKETKAKVSIKKKKKEKEMSNER